MKHCILREWFITVILLHEKFLQFHLIPTCENYNPCAGSSINKQIIALFVRDISKLFQISQITISKYHLWYLCQVSLEIMLLPIQIKNKIT